MKTLKQMLMILSLILTNLGTSQTPQQVLSYVKKRKICRPYIVTAQAILETGWFKCKGCSMDGNNIFGFRIADRYLRFGNWKQSVDYYARWQERKYKGGDYFEFLEKIGYAEDSSYVSKIRCITAKLLP